MAEAQATTTTNTSQGSGKLCALLAEFRSPGALKAAAMRVRDAGFTRWDAHSPFPLHGLDPKMGIRMTKLPLFVFACGLTGCLAGLLLQWWTNATNSANFSFVPTFLQGYDFLISGKPYFSLPANIPIIFELTVLFSAIGAGVGMLVFNDLPRFSNPLFSNQRFRNVTADSFFISVSAADPIFNVSETRRFLEAIGAMGVESVQDTRGDGRIPRPFIQIGIILVCASLIPLGIIVAARGSKSSQPRIHIIQDMDNQPKYKPQQAGPFRDLRAMRPPVAGTVARGEIRADEHYYRGMVDGEYAVTFPTEHPGVTLDEEFIRRGQNRFNIFCAACHGRDGSGNGMVNIRATERGPWAPASNLHDAQVRERPVGHLFNTITNGLRNMPPYGDQLSETDRWAVAAYIRALQRAERATPDELPPDVRSELESR